MYSIFGMLPLQILGQYKVQHNIMNTKDGHSEKILLL